MILRIHSFGSRLILVFALMFSMATPIPAATFELLTSETTYETNVFQSETKVRSATRTQFHAWLGRIAQVLSAWSLFVVSLLVLFRISNPRLPFYPSITLFLRRLMLFPVKRTTLIP